MKTVFLISAVFVITSAVRSLGCAKEVSSFEGSSPAPIAIRISARTALSTTDPIPDNQFFLAEALGVFPANMTVVIPGELFSSPEEANTFAKNIGEVASTPAGNLGLRSLIFIAQTLAADLNRPDLEGYFFLCFTGAREEVTDSPETTETSRLGFWMATSMAPAHYLVKNEKQKWLRAFYHGWKVIQTDLKMSSAEEIFFNRVSNALDAEGITNPPSKVSRAPSNLYASQVYQGNDGEDRVLAWSHKRIQGSGHRFLTTPVLGAHSQLPWHLYGTWNGDPMLTIFPVSQRSSQIIIGKLDILEKLFFPLLVRDGVFPQNAVEETDPEEEGAPYLVPNDWKDALVLSNEHPVSKVSVSAMREFALAQILFSILFIAPPEAMEANLIATIETLGKIGIRTPFTLDEYESVSRKFNLPIWHFPLLEVPPGGALRWLTPNSSGSQRTHAPKYALRVLFRNDPAAAQAQLKLFSSPKELLTALRNETGQWYKLSDDRN